MSLYGRIFAALYDRMMAASEDAGLRDKRAALLAQARGAVLEIGAGTGANAALYPEGLERLVLAEPEAPMAARLRAKSARSRPDAEVVQASAEALPFADASFDTVVSTLVLCTVGDPARAAAELRRVLKPDGRLLVLEHVRAHDNADRARWQDRLEPVWRRIGHGCVCNRDTRAQLDAAGFDTDALAHDKLPKAAPIVRPLIRGAATPR